MSISILVEPGANGFRAAAGSPLDLSAEGDSAAAAVAALRGKIANRLSGGSHPHRTIGQQSRLAGSRTSACRKPPL